MITQARILLKQLPWFPYELPVVVIFMAGVFLIIPIDELISRKEVAWWKRPAASSWVMLLLAIYMLIILALKFRADDHY